MKPEAQHNPTLYKWLGTVSVSPFPPPPPPPPHFRPVSLASHSSALAATGPLPSVNNGRTTPEILIEFHLARLHRAGKYKQCVVEYPQPNAAAYDMYSLPPLIPHETTRKVANRKHRACKATRKFPSGGNGKDAKALVPEDTMALVPENPESAVISSEKPESYDTTRLNAKLAEMLKED